MFTKFFTIGVSVALNIISASANPIARSTCTPNAQGAAVSIVSSASSAWEWSDLNTTPANEDVLYGAPVGGFAPPNFHLSQDGQYPLASDVNNNLAATSSGGELIFTPTSAIGDQEYQLFNFTCQSCGTDTTPGQAAGLSCKIFPVGYDEGCVQISNTFYEPLFIGSCDSLPPSPLQLFDIIF
ncbi:hypothetical protein BT96DRAFT_1009887 [Gymnopus androsaceus JB14]|uniref:Uncharacterized protein n=1 Tax=Gymnopus androsaceus JB14 TaxID=1447944 RepID=A0A6A4GBM5_9AGAR|nr:hypothetical protein BT96DRAFT_1009887 [Gymnopus androsaceus JB14]